MSWLTFSIFVLPLLFGITSGHRKIIGGTDTKIQFFPYQVSLRYLGNHFCGGSIISHRHILTAAHCVDIVDTNFLTIHSGTSDSNELGKVHGVLSVRIHPEWERSEEKGYPNDIAVLALTDIITFNMYQKKVDLPKDDVHNYEIAYLTGWGWKTNSNNIVSQILQKVPLKLLTTDKCKSMINHKISKKQICAFNGYGNGVCRGDSGGPLVSKGQIVGIVSFTDTSKCAIGHPDIFTNVFAYKDFIESAMHV